jgi:hypothetical protein
VASHPPRPLQPTGKPELAASKPEPKAEAPKPITKPDAKTADAKPVQTKSAEAKPVVKLDIAPVKNETAKPEVKAASAKPAATPDTKTETKPAGKSSIPGLRLSANAF